MEETYDLKAYKEEYRRVLDLAESTPLEKTVEALDLYYDVCCGCVLVVEASLREQEDEWEIASLAECCSSMLHGWKSSTTCLTPHTEL